GCYQQLLNKVLEDGCAKDIDSDEETELEDMKPALRSAVTIHEYECGAAWGDLHR
ncbi:Hypothetical predicted protein, partial [Pelobates cultripes]